MKKITAAVCIMMILTALVFCGCSTPPDTSQDPVDVQNPSTDTQNPPADTDNPPEEGDNPPDDVQTPPETSEPEITEVSVGSIKEFLDAIGPDTVITLEPGNYNLSESLDEIWAEEGEMWNVNHPYVQIRECYDGLQLLIQNADNLVFNGGTEDFADTEIVTVPRYATVLSFYQCDNVEMKGLTIGHTDYVSCAGNVLDFFACNDVKLNNMDIYGCGLFGIGAYRDCGNIAVSSSNIRDCSDGPLWLVGGTGTYEFTNCRLTGSWGGGYYESSDASVLRFVECEFGESESNKWYFNEEAEFVDCVWSEITQYPEY